MLQKNHKQTWEILHRITFFRILYTLSVAQLTFTLTILLLNQRYLESQKIRPIIRVELEQIKLPTTENEVNAEAVTQKCSVKKVFLKIFQNSKESTCARVSFLTKLQASALYLQLIKKETLVQVFYCEFCEISKNTFFTEHHWATASVRAIDDTHIKIAKSNKYYSYDNIRKGCFP